MTHVVAPVAVRTQHAPLAGVGAGHTVPRHAVPRPRNAPCRTVQSAGVVTTQIAPPLNEGTQHAPVVWGTHVPFMHVVPFPRYVPLRPAQSAAVVITHVTLPVAWMQHAPFSVGEGHGDVLHDVFAPRNVPC